MGYDIFGFGALYLGDEIQHFPFKLREDWNIPQYDRKSRISIAAGSREETIIWVKPQGVNLLVADRILLANVSWTDLDKNGFVEGKETVINGQRFHCRLLRVGKRCDEANE